MKDYSQAQITNATQLVSKGVELLKSYHEKKGNEVTSYGVSEPYTSKERGKHLVVAGHVKAIHPDESSTKITFEHPINSEKTDVLELVKITLPDFDEVMKD